MSDRGESAVDTDADEQEREDEEWRFSLEDIEEREREAAAAAAAQERRQEPLEAGTPSLESTVFFLLGVSFALFVVWRLLAG